LLVQPRHRGQLIPVGVVDECCAAARHEQDDVDVARAEVRLVSAEESAWAEQIRGREGDERIQTRSTRGGLDMTAALCELRGLDDTAHSPAADDLREVALLRERGPRRRREQ